MGFAERHDGRRWARWKHVTGGCQTGIRGASGVETCFCCAAWVGERAGARRGTGQCRFDVAETPSTRGHEEAPGPRRELQIKFDSRLGLGRAGRAGRGEVGRLSRPVKESRKRLAGAYSNRDKGQARTAGDRAGVARLKRWSARLKISPSLNGV